MKNTKAKWIKTPSHLGQRCPAFKKDVHVFRDVKKAIAKVSAYGVYDFFINKKKVGDAFMAPGWTSYLSRVQYQTYDITDMLAGDTAFEIMAGKGWALSDMGFRREKLLETDKISVIADIKIEYADGTTENIVTDGTWGVYTTEIIESEMYDGELVDKTADIEFLGNALVDDTKKPELVSQIGEFVREQEKVYPSELIITPKGEKVIDFGQNLAGYVEIRTNAKRGEKIVITHAEVLDKDGNFYTDNLRSAKNRNRYIASGEGDIFKPRFCFQGFRYIRIDEYPSDEIDINDFCAIVVYSDIKRTGHFSSGYDKLNRLYSNVIWGQQGNFIDVPTDCPQRDERLGWTGDAEVFCRTAAINFDVEKFFKKWLGDVALEQAEDGGVAGIVPRIEHLCGRTSAAWGDVATIIPWEMYRAYGNVELLREHYPMMKKWVEYMRAFGVEEYLWLGGKHFGDWLAMDAGYGIYFGATQNDFIASAFYAYSTALVIKAGKVLGYDMSEYEELYTKVRAKFRECFMKDGMPVYLREYKDSKLDLGVEKDPRPIKDVTQTAITLILRFELCEENEKEALVSKLCSLIEENGGCMTTGFVGTPHILHALSDNGRAKEAFDLLLQEKAPSWLFSVNMGATTVWEHWDSVDENGKMWSTDMNSFNHYAYGSVFDWVYGDMLGIKIDDDGAAYTKLTISPLTDKRIGFAEGSIETRQGKVSSSWRYIGDKVRYEFEIPENTRATIKISGMPDKTVSGGRYTIVK